MVSRVDTTLRGDTARPLASLRRTARAGFKAQLKYADVFVLEDDFVLAAGERLTRSLLARGIPGALTVPRFALQLKMQGEYREPVMTNFLNIYKEAARTEVKEDAHVTSNSWRRGAYAL